jgi:AcrR family transcriptional regulator
LPTVADAPTLRREPQQARSRARLAGLVDAAEALLVREGPDALSTTRIAAEAGVSVGSLYQYFPDKAAIVDAVAHRYLGDFEELMEGLALQAAPGRWEDPVGTLVDAFAERYAARPGYRALWLGRHLSDELRAADHRNKEVLADGVRRILVAGGAMADGPGAALAARAGVLAADALLQEAFRLDAQGDPDLLAEAKQLLRAYLGSSAARFPPPHHAGET